MQTIQTTLMLTLMEVHLIQVTLQRRMHLRARLRLTEKWQGLVASARWTRLSSSVEDARKESVYQPALALLEAGNYEEARVQFLTIAGYKDVDDRLAEILANFTVDVRQAGAAINQYKVTGELS